MAESQKGTSSSVNSKEKDSLLDLDFGKDFLSSWKSMSAADDSMDLDFEPVAKGKKKAFNFDKADMEFNIGCDFGKIPSFNIDMPDLDISSPLKKDAKTEETSNKEPATGNNKGKADHFADHFAFSFDFNELDGFKFKSSPRKEDIKAKTDERKEKFSNRIGAQNAGASSAEVGGDNVAHEDVISGLPAPRALITPNLDAGSGLSTIESCLSKSIPNGCVLLNSVATVDDAESHEAVTSLEKTISTNKQQSDCLVDKLISPEPVPEKASVDTEAIQDASAHSTSRDVLSQNTISELPEEVSSGAKRHIASSQKDNGGSQFRTDNHALAGNEEGSECAQGESIPNTKGNVMNQNTLELSMNLLSRTTANNLMPEKQREAFITSSKYFKPPHKTEDMSQLVSNQTTPSSLSDKMIGTRQPRLVAESRKGNGKETQSDGKLTDTSLSNSGAPVSKEHLKIGNQEYCKGIALNRALDQDILKGKLASGGGGKNFRSLDSVGLTGLTDKVTSRDSVNSANMVPNMPSLQTITNNTAERYKYYSSKAIRQMPDISSLKISRTSGANLGPSKSIPQKDRSLKDLDQIRVSVGGGQSRTAQFVETKKQTPLIGSLKRKMIQTPNADAVSKPSKRLSESPSNRNSAETSTSVIDEEKCNNENVVDGRSVLKSSQNSELDIPLELRLKELEVPFSLENDSNIEKAEACTKELDDICNMLRKKHDEAKEILVRAIVNNNKLLMLNHPLHEEKIRMVQKFALQLTLREVDSRT